MKLLDGLRRQAGFGAPDRAKSMHAQAIGSIGRIERRDAAEGKTAQHFQRDRTWRIVEKNRFDFHRTFRQVPGKAMLESITCGA